jgi:hypothetical protein
MSYDDWKTESPEDQEERINGPARRRAARHQWLEDHADDINDQRRDDQADRLMEREP